MKSLDSLRKNLKVQEDFGYVIPSSMAAIAIFIAIFLGVATTYQAQQEREMILTVIGLGGSVYIVIQNIFVAPRMQRFHELYTWINAIISGLGLSFLAIALDEPHHTFFDVLLILAVTSLSIFSERGPVYLMIAISEIAYIYVHINSLVDVLAWTIQIIPLLASIVVTETILRLRQLSQEQIHRLEMANFFSQQINSSLEPGQVLSILNAALQKSLVADSYYVGLVDKDTISLDLFYDDGEYFTDVKIPITNTLAGWVVKHQQALFLPDVRTSEQPEGVKGIVIGKNKTSLSWMGVPIQTAHINGLLAVASYKPRAFASTDMELLSNLAQHAALALDNTFHHKQVELQSRLDSLTGTYNHKFFLELLQKHIDLAYINNQVIGLIMLDVDHFKQYNDSFGHQVGDKVLTSLCETIQHHIKKTDFVGRWGGEEFVIALLGAKRDDAYQVAERIRKTMHEMVLDDLEHTTIPAPTVSQGISVYPDEATDINRLIYLADQRLYHAKERGRNQIEPAPQLNDTSSAKQ